MSATPATVLMRSKNSDWVIGEALQGLFMQSFKDFELMVVDSGSKDKTLEIVSQYPCRLMEIEAKSYFPGVVLNSAVEQIESEIIVVQNSDAIPLKPDALSELLKPFEDGSVAATYARQVPRHDALPWVRRDYASSFPDRGPAPNWIRMSFPFAAFRRSLWEKHHFYTDAWASEDQEWAAWALKEGYRVLYVPESVVMHSHNYNLKELYARRFVEGEADAFFGDEPMTLVRAAAMAAGAMARDARHYLADGDILGLFGIPARRIVEQWAFRKGFLHGDQRRRSGDRDASYGQQVVLNHHTERDPRSMAGQEKG